MTQREINRMTRPEREAAIYRAVANLDGRLNLFGAAEEPLAQLLDIDIPMSAMRARVADVMTPECDHRRGQCDHFAPWLMLEAQPAANALLRLHEQVRRAQAVRP